jgi:methionyl-tRNA formyltransferase
MNLQFHEKKLLDLPGDSVSSFIGNEWQNLRIIFLGTPEFAVASLKKLLQGGCNIVGVVTAPDKAAGRGLQVTESAIKKYASAKNLKILQPEKLKHPEFLEDLRSLKADLQVVVAFRMLPEIVWNMPPLGTINLHASLLPQYRGAAPINWAIINGEKITGLTTFKLQHEIDTGNILLQQKIIIGNDETAGELHDRMKEAGAILLMETIKKIANKSLKEIDQPAIATWQSATLKHAPKIFTDTCKIDWHKNVDEVYDLIRGLSPYPGSFTILNGKIIKIFKVEKEGSGTSISPRPRRGEAVSAGEFETDKKTFLKFACSNGYISIKELQMQGKKKLMIEEFLRGFRF